MSITSTDGVITLSGTVDGVDFAALRADVISHGHGVAGNVDDTTETISIDDAGDFEVAESSSPTDDDINIEAAEAYPSTRTHGHTVGTLAEDGTNTSTALSPSGTETTLTGTNGNVTCRTIDGYAPEVVWDEYKDHDHDLTGDTGETEPSALSIRGVSGPTWKYFRIASDSSGTGAVFEEVNTATAGHTHSADHPSATIKLKVLGAGSAPTASGGEVNWGPNDLDTDGNVNGVDISAFKTQFDTATAGNHRHQGAGITGPGGATLSTLRGISSGKTFFSDGAGNWRQVQVEASPGSAHTHGGTGIYNSNVT
jgi:hypothetical protein